MGDNEKVMDPELKAIQEAERARIAAEAAAAATARETADAEEITALQQSQKAQADALGTYNQAQYTNIGQIVSDVQSKINKASEKDEVMKRRENSYRYISGLGDTLSSLANLIGVKRGASNQQQTYNSHAVVQKAEAARKARKIEIEDLSKRLDEMKTRERELKAAGSLKEAELAAANAKEMATLKSQHRTAAETADKYYAAKGDQAVQTATAQYNTDRAYKTAKNQWEKTYDLQLKKFNEEQKGNVYNLTFANKSIDIPKEKINDANVERIYQMLPEEIRKEIKGEQFIEYGTDEYGTQTRTTAHKAPSLTQKLAAIAAYAESDDRVMNELRTLSGKKAPKLDPNKDPNL